MLYEALQIGMLALFLVALFDAAMAYRQDRKKMLLLGLAFAYALIFENLNVILSSYTYESYFYNPAFVINIGYAPLMIVMSWTVLIYTAMHISDMLNLKMMVKPFMDALLVLMIHLTFGVVAIRQGLWTWADFPVTEGWFGVPADNFIAWMFIVFMFSFLFRYFTRGEDDMVNKATRTEYFFLLPAFAYLGMVVLFSLVNLAEDIFALTRSQELFVFWALVILFALMLRRPAHGMSFILSTNKFTLFTILLARLAFYFYLAWSIVLMELYFENVTLIIILAGSVIADIIIYHDAFGHVGGDIHFGQKELRHY